MVNLWNTLLLIDNILKIIPYLIYGTYGKRISHNQERILYAFLLPPPPPLPPFPVLFYVCEDRRSDVWRFCINLYNYLFFCMLIIKIFS